MLLSIVIVNYNVKYFLKQCLASVYGSQRRLADGTELELDVWVVDNDSVDGSVDMVRQEFPQVHVIANHENVGFAKANNMALKEIENRKSKIENSADATNNSQFSILNSQFFLLLNPDTIVESDTLVRCVDFMRQHTDCGGLCVKMIDGEGRYLKESKRGFPSPEASFYKISGLIRLFPHSRRIAAYYMGHLPDDEVNEIEIMPGAFLMFTREVYEKIGGLDESYFMYGEDIDFSWRIRLAGLKNYYLPETHIIHYKGESTKKGSMNYVYTFYRAMAIFVKKYFTGRNARLFNLLLQMAIWLRAMVAWVQRVARCVAVPMADFAAAYGGFVLLKQLWATYWADNIHYYPAEYTTLVIPIYILVLMFCSWLEGGYDKPLRPWRIVRGMAVGVVLLLAFYSLLDESQRYSRMLLLTGSLWTLISTLIIRLILSACSVKGYALRARKRGASLIVGGDAETQRVVQLYRTYASPDTALHTTADLEPHHLQDRIRIDRVEEVIFCGRDIDLQSIIGLMTHLRTTGVQYRIAPAEGDFIIGTGGILSTDDLYLTDLDTISTATCRRRKRLIDIAVALLLLVLSPILFWPQKHKKQFFSDCLQVLIGRRTWVGYTGHDGIFSPANISPNVSTDLADRLLLRYMRHYRTTTDLTILLRNWNRV